MHGTTAGSSDTIRPLPPLHPTNVMKVRLWEEGNIGESIKICYKRYYVELCDLLKCSEIFGKFWKRYFFCRIQRKGKKIIAMHNCTTYLFCCVLKDGERS